MELAERLLHGDVRALARACSIADDRLPGHRELIARLHAESRRGWVLGVTGSPGVGKSTLVGSLITRFRQRGERVGVVAIDPSSPFHGGALLGDRIRLQRHFEDSEVFIRSLATRGAVGGLSRSAADVIQLLRAWGAGVTIVETVGVGQDEIDVCRTAHTTLCVLAPGLGDGVQALKAGLVEAADLFAVNKADREGADRTAADLEHALALSSAKRCAPVLRTSASLDQGILELLSALDEHRAWLGTEEGQLRLASRERAAVERVLRAELAKRWLESHATEIAAQTERVLRGELDAYAAADELSRQLGG
jgi:LAO/AO transport system kinase